jgi:hypothetical protein
VILLGLSTSVHPCRLGDLAVVRPGRQQSKRELGPLLFGSAPGVISFSRSCCD